MEKLGLTKLGASCYPFYAEMYGYENTALTTIGTQNVYHAVNHFVSGLISGFTFTSGLEGSGTVTDYSGTVAGTVLLTDVAHGLATGDIITCHSSTDYNGTFMVTVVDVDTFYFTDTYTSNQATDWAMGSYLECLPGSGGIYSITVSCTSFAATANTTFKFELNNGIVPIDNVAASRKFSNTDYGSMGSSGLTTIVAGDRIWLSCRNETSAADITVRHANINLRRIV